MQPAAENGPTELSIPDPLGGFATYEDRRESR